MKRVLVAAVCLMGSLQSYAGEDQNPEAKVKSYIWKCTMAFEASGKGSQLSFFGKYDITGTGDMVCDQVNLKKFQNSEDKVVVKVESEKELLAISENIKNTDAALIQVHIPVKITLGANSPFEVGLGDVDLTGYSMQATLLKDFHEILGEFTTAHAFTSFGLGMGGFTGLRLQKGALGIQVGIHATAGFGLSYGISTMKIALNCPETPAA